MNCLDLAGLLVGQSCKLPGVGALDSACAGSLNTSTFPCAVRPLMSPVWASTLSFCFLFRSIAHVWLWLAATNLVVWAMVLLAGAPQP